MDDMRAVKEALGVERVALLGGTDAGLTAMYAATYPDEVASLVLSGVSTSAAPSPRSEQRSCSTSSRTLGARAGCCRCSRRARSATGSSRRWARYERGSVTPSMARKLIELNLQVDLRGVLPAIQAPTLVVHRTDNQLVPVEREEAADLIPDARFMEFPGTDAYGWHEPDGVMNDAIEEF